MFIVAEIGVNWDGDFVLVREMMETVKKLSSKRFQSPKKVKLKT